MKIAVPLKCLSNFWRPLEMALINYEANLILTWSADCAISSATEETKFSITDRKHFALVVTSSPQDNAKLLQKLKSSFKRTINWNKYQSKAKIQIRKQCLDYLIDPSFQGVNRIFVLSFENNVDSTAHTG